MTNRQNNAQDQPISLKNFQPDPSKTVWLVCNYIATTHVAYRLVCLFVCMSIAYSSQFQTDIHETSPPGRVHHKQEAYCFRGQMVNIGQRSTTKLEFLKSSIFIPLTWNLKRICISGFWIQPPIIFVVNISQKVIISRISKVVNFHAIDLKF